MLNTYKLEPVTKERVHELDIIRGFALVGILLANMMYFATPGIYVQMAGSPSWAGALDQAAYSFITFFASGKFFPMFSFLFGLGFVVFFQRAIQRSERPYSLYLRRIFFLFMFGIIHAFGIWYGDILLIYALLAPVLLLFYNRKGKTILRWAFAILLVPTFLLFLGMMVLLLGDEASMVHGQEEVQFANEMMEQSLAVYGSGTVLEIFQQRALDYTFAFQGYLFMIPTILFMFLLGVYVAKTERYRNLQQQKPFLKKFGSQALRLGCHLIYFSYIVVRSQNYFCPCLLMGSASCLVGQRFVCFISHRLDFCVNPTYGQTCYHRSGLWADSR